MLNTLAGIIASSGGAAAGGDYESIATVTVGAGGASSVTFSSIPSTYKHLQIRAITRTNRGTYSSDPLSVTFNSDSASNYSYHTLTALGANPVLTSAGSSVAFMDLFQSATAATTSGTFSGAVIDILDYADTNKYKTARGLSGFDNNTGTANLEGYITFASGNWRSTSAVTSITMVSRYGTAINQYSSFALYGIKG